jgi:hypothetical protein
MLEAGQTTPIIVSLDRGLRSLEIYPESGSAFLTVCDHQRTTTNTRVEPGAIVSTTIDGMTTLVEFQGLDHKVYVDSRLGIGKSLRDRVVEAFTQHGFEAVAETPHF